MQRVEREFAGRKLIIETGRMAKQAAGSALVQYRRDDGPRRGHGQRQSQARCPSSRSRSNTRRRPTPPARFPAASSSAKGVRTTTRSCRHASSTARSGRSSRKASRTKCRSSSTSSPPTRRTTPTSPRLLAVSFALQRRRRFRWNGPLAGVRVGRLQDKWVLNPTFQQLAYSDMDIVVAGSKDSIVMVEGGALEVSEDDVVERASRVAHKGDSGADRDPERARSARSTVAEDAWTKTEIAARARRQRQEARRRQDHRGDQPEGQARAASRRSSSVKKEVAEQLATRVPRQREGHRVARRRRRVQRAARAGARQRASASTAASTNEVRPITIDTSRAAARARLRALHARPDAGARRRHARHGERRAASRLDRRSRRARRSRSCCTTTSRRSPPVKCARCAARSRREIGHGNLAERALQARAAGVRRSSRTRFASSRDVLESNGSSSMASVCGGSLALFDAGVPIHGGRRRRRDGARSRKATKYAILTDILGTEDHLGDMDFKVAGTEQGITSIQMDIKIEGLDLKIMQRGARAGEGRPPAHPRRDEEGARRAAREICRRTRRASSRCRSAPRRSAT